MWVDLWTIGIDPTGNYISYSRNWSSNLRLILTAQQKGIIRSGSASIRYIYRDETYPVKSARFSGVVSWLVEINFPRILEILLVFYWWAPPLKMMMLIIKTTTMMMEENCSCPSLLCWPFTEKTNTKHRRRWASPKLQLNGSVSGGRVGDVEEKRFLMKSRLEIFICIFFCCCCRLSTTTTKPPGQSDQQNLSSATCSGK